MEVPLRYLGPSIIYFVPCDRVLQRAQRAHSATCIQMADEGSGNEFIFAPLLFLVLVTSPREAVLKSLQWQTFSLDLEGCICFRIVLEDHTGVSVVTEVFILTRNFEMTLTERCFIQSFSVFQGWQR